MADAVIKASALGFAYRDRKVLDNVDFAVSAGEIYGLVGADGAGKTTLLQLVTGQLSPAAGSIQIFNTPAGDPALRDDIAYMPQGFGLYPDLSVQENLEFFADLHGLAAGQADLKIKALLQRTGLAGFEDRRGGNLSGGMMQKLALACALVHEPRVMFLDEPTTGVDPLSRRSFWQLLDGVRSEGVTILYATANMDEAERCDRVGFLEAGRLRRQGTPLELARSDDAVLVGVLGPEVRRYRHDIAGLPGVQLAFPIGLRLNVWLDRERSLDLFQKDLDRLSADLIARREQPTLHDATLRELIGMERRSHAGA